MNAEPIKIQDIFKGKFFKDPESLLERFLKIKAFVFDWDGVFNNGIKDENGSSAFSEVDAMGTNLLRYNHFLLHERLAGMVVISGEQNKAAFTLARREHFDAVYYKVLHKADALRHFCNKKNLQFDEVAFVFDDVLDFSLAQLVGLRIMVGRSCNPLLTSFAIEGGLVDYLTFAEGGHHAVRETVELLTALSGRYKETITGRMQFNEHYRRFLHLRNQPSPFFCTVVDSVITEQIPL
jgi:3-deoxy-D-manno-octulosonate 8-phosphate phosphatase (KDO 8-P phosphatase)